MPQLLILKVGQVADISWTLSETVDLIISQRNSPSDQIDRPPNSGKWDEHSWKALPNMLQKTSTQIHINGKSM